MSDFEFDLDDLQAGEHRAIDRQGSIDVRTDVGWVDSPVVCTGTMTGTTGGAVVAANLAATLELMCVRCLRSWRKEAAVSLEAVFEPIPDPDVFPLEDGRVDLEPPMRDELLAEISDSTVHAPDCRGLCGTCGFDLNSGDCECPEAELSSPFAALKELFDS